MDYKYLFITAAGSYQVKARSGVLHSIVVGETAATAIQIADSATSDASNMGNLKASIVENTYVFDCEFTEGLRIKCGAGKYTIIYR